MIMDTPQDRYVKVGSINTRYWAEGGSGSPVIFIHGIWGIRRRFYPVSTSLPRSIVSMLLLEFLEK